MQTTIYMQTDRLIMGRNVKVIMIPYMASGNSMDLTNTKLIMMLNVKIYISKKIERSSLFRISYQPSYYIGVRPGEKS